MAEGGLCPFRRRENLVKMFCDEVLCWVDSTRQKRAPVAMLGKKETAIMATFAVNVCEFREECPCSHPWLFCSLLLGGTPAVESICLQVGPVPANGKWTRSANQTKAVVLVHGFYYHFKDKSVPKAELRPWQKADSPLVKELAKTSDVYVFGYGQNGSVDAVANQSKLGDNIAQLKQLGYTEIILVGHTRRRVDRPAFRGRSSRRRRHQGDPGLRPVTAALRWPCFRA